jgi:hypothetical protein
MTGPMESTLGKFIDTSQMGVPIRIWKSKGPELIVHGVRGKHTYVGVRARSRRREGVRKA